MRFSTSAIVAFATSFAFVAAQDLSKVPSCAIPCFATAVQGSGCSLTDTKCQCTTGKDSISNSLLQCAPARCSADDLNKISSAVLELCAGAGVTITSLPSIVASATGSMRASGSAASVSASRTASGTPAAAATTNAAAGSVVGAGAIAMGVFALVL